VAIASNIAEPLPGARAIDGDWPSPGRAWYALTIFALTLMVNILDRGILALLIPPIKADLQLSDTQVSLLIGFAFVIFYAIMGLPIARLVDTRSRRVILAVCVSIWSGMTALCGLAQNFWQLFWCRVMVGVGEAGSGPATYSMMADLFPRDRLPRAISVLNFGFVAGQGISLVIGGLVIKLVADVPEVTLPLLGTLRSWQLALIAVGLPGLVIAALMTTVAEPRRRGLLAPQPGVKAKALPIRQVAGFLKENRGTYLPMMVGMAIKAVLSFGTAIWLPTMFVREFGWTITRIGVTQGIILMVCAPIGLMLGSHLAERLTRSGRDDAFVRVVVIAGFFAIPLSVAFPLMPNPTLALTLYAINTVILFMVPGPQNAALQAVTPNEMRGQVTAVWLFLFNFVGYGFGPTFIALITDYVFHDEARLPEALALSSGILGTIAMIIIMSGMKSYGEMVRRIRLKEATA
jgi:MFS family permease